MFSGNCVCLIDPPFRRLETVGFRISVLLLLQLKSRYHLGGEPLGTFLEIPVPVILVQFAGWKAAVVFGHAGEAFGPELVLDAEC